MPVIVFADCLRIDDKVYCDVCIQIPSPKTSCLAIGLAALIIVILHRFLKSILNPKFTLLIDHNARRPKQGLLPKAILIFV